MPSTSLACGLLGTAICVASAGVLCGCYRVLVELNKLVGRLSVGIEVIDEEEPVSAPPERRSKVECISNGRGADGSGKW